MANDADILTLSQAEVIVADILKSAAANDLDEMISCKQGIGYLAKDAAAEPALVANGVAAYFADHTRDFYAWCLALGADHASVVMAMIRSGCTRRACRTAFMAAGIQDDFAIAYAAAALKDAA